MAHIYFFQKIGSLFRRTMGQVSSSPESNEYTSTKELVVPPLHEEIMRQLATGDNRDRIEELIRGGADVDQKDPGGLTPLHIATVMNDGPTVSRLLSLNADPNLGDNFEKTPLHVAAETGSVEMASLLADGGAKIDARDTRGRTPLVVAAENKQIDMMRLLAMELGADVSVRSSEGASLFHVAVKMENVAILDFLVDAVAVKDAVDAGLARSSESDAADDRSATSAPRLWDAADSTGETPLFIAVRNKSPSMVRHLVEKVGVDVGCRNLAGATCWHLAAVADDKQMAATLAALGFDPRGVDAEKKTPLHLANGEEVARTLLRLGAVVDAPDENGQTPMHLAAMFGRQQVVTALLEAGADLALKDNNGNDAVFVAAASGNSVGVAVLVTGGADVHSENHDGYTALHGATMWQHADCASVLLSAGAPLHKLNVNLHSPLSVAVMAGNQQLVRLFLAHGSHVNLPDAEGNTPLHLAVLNRQLHLLPLLLQHKASADIPNQDGCTPLHSACDLLQTEAATLLLGAKANVNAVDKEGQTPLHKASLREALPVVELLLNANADAAVEDNNGVAPATLIAARRWMSRMEVGATVRSRMRVALKVVAMRAACGGEGHAPDTSLGTCTCFICWNETSDRQHVLVPCGHGVLCADCANQFRSPHSVCPIGRERVEGVQRVYLQNGLE